MHERPQISPSRSDALSLDDVVTRLARHDVVAGIVLIGSTGDTTLTAASDYDLLIVLSTMPAPMHVALTTIEGRLADIIFILQSEIDALLTRQDAIPQDSWEARLLHWVQTGRVVVDRQRQLQRLQQNAAALPRATLPDAGELYRTWFGINYNVLQTQRILASPDPVYQMTVDLRLLYCLSDLWVAYFRVRRLAWAGEKAAIRHLAEHDPNYLTRFQRCLAETDRRTKVAQYVALAEQTLAPLGGLWPQASTAIQFHADRPWTPGQDRVALAFWNDLLRE
jgi:hypothetical protein